MLYSDSALNQLISGVEGLGFTYEVGVVNEKYAELLVNIDKSGFEENRIDVTVWFDVAIQLFGFNLLQTGAKTYESIDEFLKYFSTYADINTVFIPKAKVIADSFSNLLGITVNFESFRSSQDNVFVADFKVENSSNIVSIQTDNDNFIAKLTEPIEDGKKYKVIVRLGYILTDDSLVLMKDVSTVAHMLQILFKNSEKYLYERLDEAVFKFTRRIDEMSIVVKYQGLVYNFLSVNDLKVSDNASYKGDLYDLDTLFDYTADTFLVDIDNTDDTEETTDTINTEVDDMEGLKICLVTDTNNNPMLVRFICEEIYDISLECAEKFVIPIDRIRHIEVMRNIRGICMTDSEKALKKFSKDITGDEDTINELMNLLFS